MEAIDFPGHFEKGGMVNINSLKLNSDLLKNPQKDNLM